MTHKRIKLVKRIAEVHGTRYAERLYQEVFGATFGGSVTRERAVQSVIEACEELLEAPRRTGAGT